MRNLRLVGCRSVGSRSSGGFGLLLVGFELRFCRVSVGVDLLLGVLGGRIDRILLLIDGIFSAARAVFVLVAADQGDAREYGEQDPFHNVIPFSVLIATERKPISRGWLGYGVKP